MEDLLPTYVERLTSEETNMAVEAHLASCPACAAKRTAMGAKETEAAGQNAEETAREVDYLKKVRHRGRRRIMLAVLATLLVLAAGFAAKVFIIGSPLDADGVAVSSREEDDTLRVHISSRGSGNAFWDWTVDNQDGVVTITARSVLVSPLFRDGGGTVEVPLEGVTEIWLGRAGMGPDDLAGRCSDLRGCLGAVSVPDALRRRELPCGPGLGGGGHLVWSPIVDYTISLQTSQEPYGLTIHFSDVTAHMSGAGRALDKRMYATAPTLLALIGNLEQVQWTYAAPDGTTVTRSVTLEEVDQALPDWIEAYNLDAGADWTAPESVKDYAASPAALQQLLDLTCHGFYVVTEEDGTTIFTPQF